LGAAVGCSRLVVELFWHVAVYLGQPDVPAGVDRHAGGEGLMGLVPPLWWLVDTTLRGWV
jgi:hypothetical protein